MIGRRAAAALLATLLLAAACGKKGDPKAPLPRGPNAVSDLSVEQEGDDAVLTFRFPDRLLTGAPLTDLASIEVFRVLDPPPALVAPPSAARAAGSAGSVGELRALGAAERREATNVRLAEEAFYASAERIAALSLPAIAESTRGATVVYRDPLSQVLSAERPAESPVSLAYAVVSVRRNGERSPLSNIVGLGPAVAPEAPVLLPATLEEGRVCLEWTGPERDVLGHDVSIGGYRVYRRALAQEEYGAPLTGRPVVGTSFVDTSVPYGVPLAYTVRATLEGNPKVEGLPAEELAVLLRDVFPPPAPARLDALSEGTLVRLLWDPVEAPDLAGYAVFRAEGSGAPVRLNADPVQAPFFVDQAVKPGTRYRYSVRAVDRAGNESPASAETVAEPF